MKRIPLTLIAALFASCLPLFAQSGPKEDDFLIFDKIEDDAKAAPAAPRPAPPVATPSQRPLARTTASLHTILLEAPDKSFATGRLSTLTAKASQAGNQPQPEVEFEGATVTLQSSLEKAVKAVLTANPRFPDGVTLKVSTEGGYRGHERDAAGAAAAILLDAVGAGRELDPDAALLGGVGDDGRITAVHRLATRLRTLEGKLPSVVGVPMVSEVEVRDLALMNELSVLANIQVVSLVTLDDARALTAKARPEKVAKALELFAGVRDASAATPLPSLLKNPKFLQRLNEIATLMPNHLSARFLLQAAALKVPGRITFATSRQAILKATKPFVDITSEKHLPAEIQAVATESGNVLLRLQPKIHPSVERYLMAVKAYLRAVNNYLAIRQDSQHMVMIRKAQLEITKLLNDVHIEKEKLDKKGPVEE